MGLPFPFVLAGHKLFNLHIQCTLCTEREADRDRDSKAVKALRNVCCRTLAFILVITKPYI